jgi:hypothetical protein
MPPDEQDLADALQAPYDHYKLHDMLGETEGYLAELRYIDAALSYIADRQDFNLSQPEDGTKVMYVPLGTTYPFEATLAMRVPPEDVWTFWTDELADEVNHELESRAEEAARWAADEMAMFRYRIYPVIHTGTRTGGFNEIGTALDDIHKTLVGRTLDDTVEAIGASVDQWFGDAATNFQQDFHIPLQGIRVHQASLVATLQDGLATVKAITEFSQNDLMHTVAATRKALCDQLRLRRDSSRRDSKETLYLLTFFTGLMAIATLAIPVVSATAATASLALDFAASMSPDEGRPIEIIGGSAEDLFTAMSNTVQDIFAGVDQRYDELEPALVDLESQVDELRRVGSHSNHSSLIVPRPDLADGLDALDPSEFYHESSSRYPNG